MEDTVYGSTFNSHVLQVLEPDGLHSGAPLIIHINTWGGARAKSQVGRQTDKNIDPQKSSSHYCSKIQGIF